MDQLVFEREIELVAVYFDVSVQWLIWRERRLPRSRRWDVGDRILLHMCLQGHQICPDAISIWPRRCKGERVFAVADRLRMLMVVIAFADISDEEVNLPRVRLLKVIEANEQERQPDPEMGSLTDFQRAFR